MLAPRYTGRKMIATPEDARLLFDRWQEHRRPIHIKLLSGGLIFEGTGVVASYNPDSLQMAGHSWQFTIPLTSSTFTFSDPREIPVAAIRQAETAKYEMGLAVELPGGDRIALMEIKDSSSTPSPDEE